MSIISNATGRRSRAACARVRSSSAISARRLGTPVSGSSSACCWCSASALSRPMRMKPMVLRTSPAKPIAWLPTWMKWAVFNWATSFQPPTIPKVLCRYSSDTMPAPIASSNRPRSSTPLSRRSTSRATRKPWMAKSIPPSATRGSGRSIHTTDPTAAAATGSRVFQGEQGRPKNRQIATSDVEYDAASSVLPATINAGRPDEASVLTMNSGKATAIIITPAPHCASPSSRHRPQLTTSIAAAIDSETTGNMSMMVETSMGMDSFVAPAVRPPEQRRRRTARHPPQRHVPGEAGQHAAPPPRPSMRPRGRGAQWRGD